MMRNSTRMKTTIRSRKAYGVSLMGFAWFLAIILAMGASVVSAAPISAEATAGILQQQQVSGPLAPPIVFVLLMLLLFGAVIAFSLKAFRDAKR